MVRVRFFAFVLIAVSFLGTTAVTQAAFVTSYAYSDRVVYNGTYSRFVTAADAQNNTNAVNSGAVRQNDLSLFYARGITTPGIGGPGVVSYDSLLAAGGTGNYSQFLNSAFYGIPGGAPNPARDANNLVQIDDNNGSTVTSHSGAWTNPNFTQFRMTVAGQNANTADDLARLAVGAASLPVSNLGGYGKWLSYNLDVTFGGLNGVLNPTFGPGFYTSSGDPTTATGTFNGIFQMTGDGFYRVNLNVVKGDTYGYTNRNNGVIDEFTQNSTGVTNDYYISQFGGSLAPAAVPVPPSVVLGAIAALTLVGLRRRLFIA